jgi:hypothetical protein
MGHQAAEGRASRRSSSTVPAPSPLGFVQTVGLVAGVCALVLGVVATLVALTEHPFGYFSRDPASTLVASPVVGLLSYAGVLLTWGAAVTCAFAGVLVARARGWRHASPLFAAGAGGAYLALDDLLLLHDDIFPQKIGIAQGAVLIGYAVVALAFLWWFREVFRRHDWRLLAIATVALSIALALDFEEIHHHIPFVEGELKVWLEDSLKLFGLGFLAAFFVLLSLRMVTAAYSHVDEDEAEAEADGYQEARR